MAAVDIAFSPYADLNGNPLQNGRVYFGLPGQNPVTSPIAAYWDQSSTQPVVQPVRTINGYPSRNGTPAPVYVSGDYSRLVQDSQGRQVMYQPSVYGSSAQMAISLKSAPFNAKGDGIADDTAAINAWLAVLAKTFADGGGAYGFAPQGVYLFSGVINVPACVIQGAGEHSTVFKAGNAAAQWLIAPPPGGYDESQGANASFTDFTLDGNGVANTSLLKFGVMNFPYCRSLAIRNSAGTGLELQGTQNGLFEVCTITEHAVKNIAFSDGVLAGQPEGADGNLFLKCEISSYGQYAVYSSGTSFNNSFVECGIEYSTPTSLAAVRLNNTDGATNALFFRGGFTNVRHAIPVFDLVNGTLNYEGGQLYGGGVGTALFYLEGAGVLAKLDGNCMFSGATYLAFAHNAGAFVYDLANYFNLCTNLFGTDAGALQDSVLGRPFNSQLFLRRGQMRFPPAQVPSTDANVLDDYVEGVFAPAIQCGGSGAGINMLLAQGSYIKVGRLVMWSINVGAGVAGPAAGAVTITGLPVLPVGGNPGTAAIGSFFGLPGGSVVSAQVHPAGQYLELYTQNNGAAQVGNRAMQNTDLGANVGFTLSGCYLAQN